MAEERVTAALRDPSHPPRFGARPEASDPDLRVTMAALRIFASIVATSLVEIRRERHLTGVQMRVLALVATLEGLSATDVAHQLTVSTPVAKRICDRLVVAGLVRRSRSDSDRRRLELSVTAQGQEIVDLVTGARRRMVDDILARMQPDDRAVLARGLGAMVDAAGEPFDIMLT